MCISKPITALSFLVSVQEKKNIDKTQRFLI